MRDRYDLGYPLCCAPIGCSCPPRQRRAPESFAQPRSTSVFDRFVDVEAPNEVEREWSLERKWSLAMWGLLLGLGGRLGASRGRLYVNEGPERAKASWFQVTTTTKRQKPPKRAEFIHQQDRAGFSTLAKRSKTPLLLGRWGHLGACRNLLGPARADKRARNRRFKVKTATKCQKPLWRAELCNNQVLSSYATSIYYGTSGP